MDPTGSLSWERIWFPLPFYGTECVPSSVNTTCFPQTRIPFLTPILCLIIQIPRLVPACGTHAVTQSSPLPLPCWTRAPCLVFMLCCCCLEILNYFIFELGFYKWSRVEQWSMRMSRRDAWNTCASVPCHPFAVFQMSHRILWAQDVWVQGEWAQGEHVAFTTNWRCWWSGEATLPALARTYFQHRKKAVVPEKQGQKRNPIMSFLTGVFRCVASCLSWKWWQGKWKIGQCLLSFPLVFLSLLIHKLKVECW